MGVFGVILERLPRRARAQVEQAGRDLDMLRRTLIRGQKPSPLVERPERGSRTQPPPAPTSTAIPARQLRVTALVRETADAVSLFVENVDGTPIEFEAGQFLSVDMNVGGESLRRAYSLAGSAAPGRPRFLTVKRMQGGRVSNYINDHIRTGDIVRVHGPAGSFCAGESRDLVLIGGGSGITPLISIAHTKLEADDDARVVLIYGNRRAQDIIFRQRLDELVDRFGPRLVVDHVLDEPPESWSGAVGMLDDVVLAKRLSELGLQDHSERLYFVCGPTPMMAAARRVLLGLGTSPERIREERFQQPEQRETPAEDLGPQPVHIRMDGQERRIETTTSQTLLEAGLQAGVEMPFSCAMGGCAACMVRLVDGEVVMEEPNCLSPRERQDGYILACISRPKKPCVVEVP